MLQRMCVLVLSSVKLVKLTRVIKRPYLGNFACKGGGPKRSHRIKLYLHLKAESALVLSLRKDDRRVNKQVVYETQANSDSTSDILKT